MLALLALLSACAGLSAQQGNGSFGAVSGQPAAQADGLIAGQIIDPSGALVPYAHLTLRRGEAVIRTGVSDERGNYAFAALPAGHYSLLVEASDFRDEERAVELKGGEERTITFHLKIEVEHQQVAVTGEEMESSPDHSLGAVVLRGSDLDMLSSNSQDMKQQLTAMAGSDMTPHFYVDGFSANRLPPKSSIQEIRLNENHFSAEYDEPGADRIEIVTKPGGEHVHGDLEVFGEDSALNSQNPYVASQPPYWALFSQGDLSGPLTKASAWFVAGSAAHSESQSLIHAIISSTGEAYTQAISSPETTLDLAPRIDFQWGKSQTFSLRYDASSDTQDDLVQSELSLPSQAVDNRNTDQTFQISDTQTWSPSLVNIVRFQFTHTNTRSDARDGSASIQVQGAFNGGGNNAGQSHEGTNQYELQDHVSLLRGSHLLHFGGRLRVTQDGNTSTGGYNGLFIFPSIEAYEVTQQGIADGLTPAEIRALGGGASQFSITAGDPTLAIHAADLGVYFEDEWKMRPNMTLTPGLRYETQSGIPDHADFAPRLSYGWSIGAKDKKPAKAVLRAGLGLFYQRFTPDLILNAARQNGVREQQYVVQNPDFYPNLPSPDELGPDALTTTYQISPRLHAPILLQESVSLDKRFGKRLSTHAEYTYTRGIDLFLTRNINAPLPGTYDPNDPTSGRRPNGKFENIYEYESDGASKHDELYVKMTYTTKPVVLYGYYLLGKRDSNTADASSFPSNQYDLHADYGRAGNDLRNRAYLGGILHVPYKITLNPFFIVQSSIPFNITVGNDLNGDSQFNDRPTFATDLSRPSVYRTKWGNFDADPLPGQKTIPINYGVGPSMVMLNLNLSRDFSFGPKLPDQPAPPAPKPGQKPAKAEVARRLQLSLGLEGQNIFNIVNGGLPVGVLGSPVFGESTSLSTSQFTNSQGNRILYLHAALHF